MTHKNVTNIVLFSLIAIFALVSFGTTNIFADNGYRVVGDTEPVLTFSFRDGVEVHEFPVFEMNENLVSNSGVSFTVEGVVDESPLLHEAMDEAYKYRLSNSAFDFQFKYFDVNADFVKNGESVISFDYNNCRVDNYQIETLDSNDFESYHKEIGFAIVDKIIFVCSGVAPNQGGWQLPEDDLFYDYGESGFNFASDMRTSVTFIYDDGSEKIEFPVFDLVSAYEENPNTPEFLVEGVLDYYPLLYRAIDNSRDVSGVGSVSNLDFDALVELTNGEDVLRGFAKEEGLDASSIGEILQSEEVKRVFSQIFKSYSRQAAAHEKIRDFRLLPTAFSVENGMMTPTMKLKRKVIKANFEDVIQEMYAKVI